MCFLVFVAIIEVHGTVCVGVYQNCTHLQIHTLFVRLPEGTALLCLECHQTGIWLPVLIHIST